MALLRLVNDQKVSPLAKDITGMRIGMLTAIKPTHTGRRGVFWLLQCDCGNTCEQPATELLRESRGKLGIPKNCGCYRKRFRSPKYKGVGDLSSTRFRRALSQAKQRGIPFKITIRQAWNQFLRQEGKCALTGLSLFMSPSSMAEGASTASLDRIDSGKGYVRGNIQWVHIAINFMKHSLPEEEFVRWCCLVAQHRGNLLCTVPR